MGKFSDLPAEIMLDIFIRLPAESVLDCKIVSKTWKNIVHHPSFTQMHTNLLLTNLASSSAAAASDSGKFSFVFKMRDVSDSIGLYYLEYDDNERSSPKVKKLNLNPPFDQFYSDVVSVNGLICITGLPKHCTKDWYWGGASYVFSYICNPMTRECITLPELDRETYAGLVCSMLYGFGYVASTNEYKVVRLYTLRRKEEFAQIEVYTLGSDKGWRSAGMIKDTGYLYREHEFAVFVDGFLYWDFRKGRIMAFDLAKEAFVELDESWNRRLRVGVLGGHLCGSLYSKDHKNCDVWLLKKKEDNSFMWSKEFSLTGTDKFTTVIPTSIAITSSCKVLCYSGTKLYLYDLQSSSSIMLEDFGRRIWRGIPHINTLVSLKAFGEESMETLDSAESAIEAGLRQMKQH